MHHFHPKVPCQKPMLRQIEWWLQNEPITKNSFASNCFIFLKILFQFKNLLEDLIWFTNNPNTHIRTFCKHWSFIWWYFFPVSILNINFTVYLYIKFQLNCFFFMLSWNISVKKIFSFQKLKILFSEILLQRTPPHASFVLLF